MTKLATTLSKAWLYDFEALFGPVGVSTDARVPIDENVNQQLLRVVSTRVLFRSVAHSELGAIRSREWFSTADPYARRGYTRSKFCRRA